MSRIIYTIGYGKLQPGDLVNLTEGLDVTIVDVRGRPTSRRKGFGGRQLQDLLGSRYVWMGDKLGGIYHLPNAQKLWPDGIRKMLADVERPLMLCQCHAPGGCHRHMLALEIERMRKVPPRAPVPAIEPSWKTVHIFEDHSVDSVELQRSIKDGDDYDATIWDYVVEDLRRAWEGPDA